MLRAIEILLPKRIHSVLKQTFFDQVRVPSESVLSRFRIVMDAGLMLMMRDVNKEFHSTLGQLGKPQPVRCLLSDSSPQGLENWQITEVFMVRDAVRIASVVDNLCDCSGILTATPDEQEDLDLDLQEYIAMYKKDTQTLLDGVEHHVLPPTGLGLRKGNYVHKVNAVLHSIYNETHSFQVFRNTFSKLCSPIEHSRPHHGLRLTRPTPCS